MHKSFSAAYGQFFHFTFVYLYYCFWLRDLSIHLSKTSQFSIIRTVVTQHWKLFPIWDKTAYIIFFKKDKMWIHVFWDFYVVGFFNFPKQILFKEWKKYLNLQNSSEASQQKQKANAPLFCDMLSQMLSYAWMKYALVDFFCFQAYDKKAISYLPALRFHVTDTWAIYKSHIPTPATNFSR